jgi:hypothetical protein
MVWSVIAAEVAGKHRAGTNKIGQDAAGAWVSGMTGFGGLADGLGSCSRSGEGARAVVSVVEKHLPTLFAEPTGVTPKTATDRFHLLVDLVREDVFARAAADGCPIEEFHSTLLAVALGVDWMAAASIGDGFLAVRFLDEVDYVLALPPAPARYVDETATVLAADAHTHLRVYFAPRPAARVFGSSDGLTRHGLVYREDGWVPHQPFFRNLLEGRLAPPATELAALDLLNHPQINTDEVDDDKSLIAFFRLDPRPAIAEEG